jgi:hypothetical protein
MTDYIFRCTVAHACQIKSNKKTQLTSKLTHGTVNDPIYVACMRIFHILLRSHPGTCN